MIKVTSIPSICPKATSLRWIYFILDEPIKSINLYSYSFLINPPFRFNSIYIFKFQYIRTKHPLSFHAGMKILLHGSPFLNPYNRDIFSCEQYVWNRDTSQAHGTNLLPTWVGPCVVKELLDHRVVVRMCKAIRPMVVQMHVDYVYPCIQPYKEERNEGV